MQQAALQAGRDPDQISFTRILRVVRRHVTGQAALSPCRLARSVAQALREIHERLLPPRRQRPNPRVIKRKMANWKLKRAEHRHPLHPETPPSSSPSRLEPSQSADTSPKSPVLRLAVRYGAAAVPPAAFRCRGRGCRATARHLLPFGTAAVVGEAASGAAASSDGNPENPRQPPHERDWLRHPRRTSRARWATSLMRG